MEHVTESEALQEFDGEMMAEDDYREQREQEYFDNIQRMKDRYKDNASSPVRSTIRCACCNKRIIKKSYQTQFCGNKGKGNCKDRYWNNISDKRRHRAKMFA